MRFARFLSLAALTVAVLGVSAVDGYSDDKAAEKAKKLLRKQAEELKKFEEDKKAAAEKKAAEEKKAAAAKLAAETPPRRPTNTKPAEPLQPKAIGSGKDAVAVARFIDAKIDAALTSNKVTPAPVGSDAEFVRRAYLDVTGVIPTAAQAKAFLDDKSSDKRAKLIDELLASPNYGRHMADVWMGLLVQKSSDNRRVNFASLRTWLDDEFNKNAGWDKIVFELVSASGQQEKNPAVGFYLSNNTVDKMTDEVCKVFLGLQLQCAQCHNHPFTGWKQDEYWAMAQFFMKTRIGGVQKDPQPGVMEVNNDGRRNRFNMLPESAKTVSAKFLQAEEPKLNKADPYRPVLAKWMTSATNPFFARAMVNRTWAQFFGRGFVNPIDDMHEGNEPSHPELLNALAADFAASGFDLKHLVRAVCNTQAYQRTSKATSANESEQELFGRMTVKVLTPEQLYDSLAAVTGGEKNEPKGRDKGAKGYQPGGRDRFVEFYLAGAEQANTTEYEAGIPQALRLMNAKVLNNPAAVKAFAGAGAKPADVIEKLYLATLARRPTDAESKKLTDYVAKAGTPADAYGDVLWALLNSSEFAMVR